MSELPRKRSKWEVEPTVADDAEEIAAERERKRKRKQQQQSSSLAAQKLAGMKASASNSPRDSDASPRSSSARSNPAVKVSTKQYSTGLYGCRSVYCYERLNHIEEGSYGVVSRARDKETGDM